ncbi:hypothetical protein F5Y13DRAFT_202755 [Hypoxylon sp. FL1857]|nr:hypothetical protein F5Y13DRAFT_202755 [Hypoxylon sp. FL1857]
MRKPLRTYSTRSNRPKSSPSQNVSPRKRKIDLVDPNEEAPSHTGLVSSSSGLDWSWVNGLDQDPTGQSHFPPRFEPPTENPFLGDHDDKPDLMDNADLTQYTAWVLARVKKMRVSNAVKAMIDDPNLKVKWVISLNKYYQDEIRRYREIKLTPSPVSNHEGKFKPTILWFSNSF